jgi:hypothetical protein
VAGRVEREWEKRGERGEEGAREEGERGEVCVKRAED